MAAEDWEPTTGQTALEATEETANYFFTDTDGAHITSAEGDATTGGNVLITSLGMKIRNGVQELAYFLGSSIGLGKWSSSVQVGDTATISLYEGSAELELKIGSTRDTLTVSAGDVVLAGQSISLTAADDIYFGTSSQVNAYSTTEKTTGKKWIDGRPIYRKVVTHGGINDGTTAVNHGISNLGTVIGLDSYTSASSGTIKIPFEGCILKVSSTQILFYVSGGVAGFTSGLTIIDYTKTA